MILHHLYLTTLIAMMLGGHHVRTSPSGHHVQGQGHGHDRMKSEEPEGSVLLRIGDEMVEMLGLSKADMEELQVQGVPQLSIHFVLVVFSASRALTEKYFTIF